MKIHKLQTALRVVDFKVSEIYTFFISMACCAVRAHPSPEGKLFSLISECRFCLSHSLRGLRDLPTPTPLRCWCGSHV